MGIGASIDIGGLIFGCWDRCSKRATSLCQLENNLENSQNQRNKLIAKRNDIVESVRSEEARHRVQLQEVAQWRADVVAATEKAENLISTGPQEIEKLCLGGCCSKNCISSVAFERKVIETLQQIDELYRRNFDAVARPRPAVAQDEIPGTEPVGLETMFEKVWRRLVEENIGIVGIWGMGGVGKTTLVKQIYKQFSATRKDFEVIWVVVSKNFCVDKVQDDIAKKLGLYDDEQWKKKSINEKAGSIFNLLRNQKFVLILDDIWQEVNLEKVGVPRPNKQSESKIVFTTRFQGICGQMRAKKPIKVEPLSSEKAWKLFTENIDEDILEIPGIRPLAKNVARECNGLPLALITISKAMSTKKTPEEWSHVLTLLKIDASKYEIVEEIVLSRLEVSYKYLPDDAARSFFLYCCLFPEDYRIKKDELIDYLICEKLIKGEDDGIDLRNKGYYEIGNLVRACLLEEEEEGECVRMHDMIRDMALWIARNHKVVGERYFVRTGAQLDEVPSRGDWQGITRMSLMENKIETIEVVPMCHNLSTMFLSGNPLRSMHENFFQFMNALTVLDLSRTKLAELPSGITKLVSLQALNLSHTYIKELPLELNRLEKLNCLNIDHTYHLLRIPRNLLSSLKQLQILRMYFCLYFSEQEGSELLAEEVPLLKHLSVLSVTVGDAATLQQLSSRCIHALGLFNFNGAGSFDISLFTEMKGITVGKSESLREFNVSSMRGGGARATSSMYNSTIVKGRSFNSLREASFLHCDHLLHLTWLILAPNLGILKVRVCESMTEIISAGKLQEITEAGGNQKLFGKLKLLHLQDLPNLESIHWTALPLPSLEIITVLRCPRLKRLPLNSESAKDRKIVIEAQERWWNNVVEWEDEATKSTFLPRFKTGPTLTLHDW